MKNKIVKILTVISVITLGLGIVLWFGTDSLINETDTITYIISLFGTVALKLLVVIATVGIIALIWLVYGIVIIFQKIKKRQFKWKYFILVAITLVLAIIVINIFNALMGTENKNFVKKEYDYIVKYQDDMNTYTIYKTGENIEVYIEEQVVCIKAPCHPIKRKERIKFSNKNMNIVNSFIDNFFRQSEYNAALIFEEILDEEQNIILRSIIYNDESILDDLTYEN